MPRPNTPDRSHPPIDTEGLRALAAQKNGEWSLATDSTERILDYANLYRRLMGRDLPRDPQAQLDALTTMKTDSLNG